jgi:putative nucleotidyltransferase with HDIG domain
MSLVENPSTSAEDLRNAIDRDPAVAARILKVANSSLYGFARAIETLQHAITLLGFRTVRNLVMAASLRQTFKHFGLAEKLIWEHSAIAGAVALCLAKLPGVGVDPEEAFTAGLLHDLGKIALNNGSHESYTKVIARVYNEGVSFVDAERDVFGFDHAELGACVARKWRLTECLEMTIRHHHDPEALAKLEPRESKLTALTAVTTAACTRLGIGRRHPVEALDLTLLEGWNVLGFQDEDVDAVLTIVAQQVDQASYLAG